MRITHIVSDVGGVIVLDGGHKKRALWEKKLRLEPGQLFREVYINSQAEKATIGEVTSSDVWINIQKKFTLSKEELDEIIVDFYSEDKVNTELYTFIQSLRGQYKTALLSNAWLNAREIYTTRYHLDEIFDIMIISAEVGMMKPSEDFFLYALNLLGATPKETLYIDDTEENINAAKTLGIQTVRFTSTKNTITEINQYLSRVSSSVLL
ncbi:MAG: HAD family phosphatase [bacterium]|nr:HAD family phosphatase [bacterium]